MLKLLSIDQKFTKGTTVTASERLAIIDLPCPTLNFCVCNKSCQLYSPTPQYLRHLLLEDIWVLVHYPCTHKSLRQRKEVQALTDAWINITLAWLCNPGRVPLPTPSFNHVLRISKLNPFGHCKVSWDGECDVIAKGGPSNSISF
jgi:hypothetical protein